VGPRGKSDQRLRERVATEVAAGIWRLPLPTPWAVGAVNAYLLDDDPLTLVDTGPIHPAAVAALEEGLRDRGRRVEDLERVIVTHQHIDHWGLAAELVRRSGAELVALHGFSEWLAAYPASLALEDGFADELLRRHGVGPVAASTAVYRGDTGYGAPALVTRPVGDGDLLEFSGRRLRVLHRPGHSPSDTVLLDEEQGVLLGADHVMARPSTPILSPPLVGAAGRERPRALRDYRASLRATAALDVDVILPGHGETVRDHRAVIAERLARYDRTTVNVYSALGSEPRRALEVAGGVRRRPLREAAMFYALCDVLGHLDELLDDGTIVEHADGDGVAWFAVA
jgi:glyoxylase-like metal-dependent hydrolase (beta-lactamase superfamily II)